MWEGFRKGKWVEKDKGRGGEKGKGRTRVMEKMEGLWVEGLGVD